MKKNERITALVAGLGADSSRALHPCYLGYFTCFNAQQYFEAHDVLEHLWLSGRDENYAFFKGLIQLAGAFVHLKKQFLRPDHPKDGARLRPAVRLFELARRNLEPYGPEWLDLNVSAALALVNHWAGAIIDSGYRANPWSPEAAPMIKLNPHVTSAAMPSGA